MRGCKRINTDTTTTHEQTRKEVRLMAGSPGDMPLRMWV